MDIKNNTANLVSISRIFVAFVAIMFLFADSTSAYIWSVFLTIVAFAMDGVDGYIARKYNQASELGSVLDIMGDRIVEASYWIVFAVLGWISVWFPIICVTRAFITDSIRSVALSKGMTAFGDKSMQSTSWGKFICASKFMRISYAVAKVMAFILLIFAATPGLSAKLASPLSVIALILAWIAIIFCVVRAVPVILESEKLFDN
ncbi:TPA: CDP-alcohol phosphatidyltransferase family protein [Candidatus Scatousia excrementigallinarum]|uniref:CDP-alcohol phosphatidyltransferase family protein n=1 Tax=Candidatus Scatousia excrementigallinarum TaxID=2840935 RepID=A0A9D1F1P3_9BACT|nr:CDP-alcohol phosphatidyltransferase family protein [Candidatus Scatousia excrementigallinarum]